MNYTKYTVRIAASMFSRNLSWENGPVTVSYDLHYVDGIKTVCTSPTKNTFQDL